MLQLIMILLLKEEQDYIDGPAWGTEMMI